MKKKNDLIKIAYKNYPIGTKYKDVVSGDIHEVEVCTFEYYGSLGGNVRAELGKGMLYCNGMWATIINEK